MFRTAYPYGLNDRIGDDYMKEQNTTMIGAKFPPLKRSFQRLSRGVSRTGHNELNHLNFIPKLNNMLKNNIKESLNFIRMTLSSIEEKGTKTPLVTT